MEQAKEHVIEKLVNELDELKTKIFKLETFMVCKDFMQITPVQKQLLEEQYDLMQKYKTVLIKRVYNLRWEMAQEKGQMAAPATEERREKSTESPKE